MKAHRYQIQANLIALTFTNLFFVLFLGIDTHAQSRYVSRGIGGGGALGAYASSPYSTLKFVGTDMGTLFRSIDDGQSWEIIRHDQARMSSDLNHAPSPGFSADGNTVFHAAGGTVLKRSVDRGIHWNRVSIDLRTNEHIRFFLSDSTNADRIFAGTDQGLFQTRDRGLTWRLIPSLTGNTVGGFMLTKNQHREVFVATNSAIYRSQDGGDTFQSWFGAPSGEIRGFTGGNHGRSVTMAFVDSDGENACQWAHGLEQSTIAQELATYRDCGYVWLYSDNISQLDSPHFTRSPQYSGPHIQMAENDAATIYATGGNWLRQYGSKVWVSRNNGINWNLTFHVYNWDVVPFAPWRPDRLQYSSIGLDVGWDDNAYTSFQVNQRRSSEVGGTGYYFLHTSNDFGQHWLAPFTQFRDEEPRRRGQRWSSTGLEVTSIMKLKFHPRYPLIGYATAADIGGLVTEDGGHTWRVSKIQYNTNYDYAFDPQLENRVYAVSGSVHDFPFGGYGHVIDESGGVYRSDDRGRNWRRISPTTPEWERQFLSIAYDSTRRILYAGTQGGGIARSQDDGRTWEFINDGIPAGTGRIIPQIEIDPLQGNVYCLLAGDAPQFTNRAATGIYFLNVAERSSRWQLLRQNVITPSEVNPAYQMWWYPSSFAIDFSRPQRDVLWLSDMEARGSWLASGIWKTTNRGQTWERSLQMTHPTNIRIDSRNSQLIYASGTWQSDGSWGAGGAYHSRDGGAHWNQNTEIPLLENLYSTQADPTHPENAFFLFFGGGMLYGPRQP